MGGRRFILSNLLKGFLWFGAIIGIYLIFKRNIDIDFLSRLEPLFSNEKLMYSIFFVSEIIIGIIPPEVFFIWALRFDPVSEFIWVISALAFTSYFAGIAGYFIGRYLNNTLLYRYFRRRFLSKMEKRLQQFGLYLIIIASLTPVPFSGVAMLVGSVKYPFSKYSIYSLFRFLRFGVYAWIIWETQQLV
jgi:membrane protein YqaA with SNARE-associated domain